MQKIGSTAGWIIAVMVEAPDADGPAAHYFAIAKPDQQRAEWAAVDLAVQAGRVATSPFRGAEPVKAVTALSAATLARFALTPGSTRVLGPKLPRRWLS